MSILIINNYVIDDPIVKILKQIRSEITTDFLKEIKPRSENIRITCPFHKDGRESRASCDVYCGKEDDVEYGFFKCFTCGEQGPLYKLVARCFGQSEDFAKDWLIERFGNVAVKQKPLLPEIILNRNNTSTYLDEHILDTFQSYHPYMTQRKLSQKVIEMFKIKYDPETKCLVFPVWDAQGNLMFMTRRSVVQKMFKIDDGVEKPVYLLNYINKFNIKEVAVCESQINALYCWSIGIPAVALFGTGAKNQYEILNHSGIRVYYLMFDGDDAGDSGREKFIKNIRKDVIISTAILPRGKDVNDLTEEEVYNLQYY